MLLNLLLTILFSF